MLILEKYLLRAEVKKVGSWWKPPPPSSSPPVLRSKILGFFLKLYCVFFQFGSRSFQYHFTNRRYSNKAWGK